MRVRSQLVAQISGNEDQFERAVDAGIFGEVSGLDDREVLESNGIDADEVQEAGEKALKRKSSSLSQKDAIITGITDQENPDESAVVSFAEEHGIDRDKASEIIEKMIRTGSVSRQADGSLRLV